MTFEHWAFAGATAALLLALAVGVPPPDRRTLGHPGVVAAVLMFVVSLIVRALCAQPTLIHADLVAPELVDCVLQFPERCTTRGASYGQYGFLVLGLLTKPWGDDLHAVFHAVEAVAAFDLALLAVLAHRLSGSAWAALLTVAVTGTNPVFMRVAASEDMHNMALCLGLLGFIAMDVYAATRRTTALVAAVLSIWLMVHTRQTFYVFLPCIFLLGLARGGRALLRSGVFWVAGVAAVLGLASRTAGGQSPAYLGQLFGMLLQPVLWPDLLRYHPLFDLTRFGVLPVLMIVAIVWAFAAGPIPRATAVAFTATFLSTFGSGLPSPGVEFAQRLPVYALGALLVAMAGASLLETRVGAARRAVAGLVAACMLLAIPPLFPGWDTLSRLTPVHREYLAVESVAAALPPEFSLVSLPIAEETIHGHPRYAGLLTRMGKRVHTGPADEIATLPPPRLFLENVECWTYSFTEVSGITNETAGRQAFTYRWDHVLFGRQRSTIRPADGLRPECASLLRDATPRDPRQDLADPEDDPPFLFYSSNVVPIRFHEVRSTPRE